MPDADITRIADAMNAVEDRIHAASDNRVGVVNALDMHAIQRAVVGTEIDALDFMDIIDQAGKKAILGMCYADIPIEAAITGSFFEAFLGGYLFCEKRMRELEAELQARIDK